MDAERQYETPDLHYLARSVEPVVARQNGSEHSVKVIDEPRRQSGSRVESAHATGRLFGWLVNYDNPDGVAVELREGKFFVTRTSLKENDMIIDDETVSTPHAMVTISLESGLQIQDLMSAQGFFYRKRGTDTYHREYYSTLVEHGDWIRFGEVEFMVSLIAHVGVK